MSFNLKTYKRGSDMLAPPELKKVHPLGKSPIVTIKPAGSTSEPLVLAESGLIFEYLCEYFAPHLVPAKWQDGKEGKCGGETESWLRFRFFMHYAEGSLMSNLLIGLIMDRTCPFSSAPVHAQATCGVSLQMLTFSPQRSRHLLSHSSSSQ